MKKLIRRLATRITERWPSTYWWPALHSLAYYKPGPPVSLQDFTEAMKARGVFELQAKILTAPDPLTELLKRNQVPREGRTMEIPIGTKFDFWEPPKPGPDEP